MGTTRAAYCLLGLLATTPGCIGNGTPDGLRAGQNSNATGAASGAAGQGTLRLLTVAQYHNSIRDIFGAAVTVPDLAADLSLGGFASIGASQVGMAPTTQDKYAAAADSIAAQATNPNTRAALGCTPSGAQDANCASLIVQQLGRKIWRRPLTTTETQRYVAVFSAQGATDFYANLQPALRGLLLSPYFLYRVEVGHPSAQNANVYVLDNYELASRLSYLLWNSSPDADLLDAAGAGELQDAAGLSTQVERLLADARANEGLGNFFTELYGLGAIGKLGKTSANFPNFTAAVENSLAEQITRTLADDVLAEGADARNLFTGTNTYINADLAAYYGFTDKLTQTWQKVAFPAGQMRAGVLGQPGIMAILAHPTDGSATLRGKFIREALLCQTIPPPPPNVDTNLPAQDANHPVTARQRMTAHRSAASCAACHNLMDPLGMTFETFDGTGAYRSTDHGLTLDLSGTLDGASFTDAGALSTLLHDNPGTTRCLAQKFMQYSLGRDIASTDNLVLATLQSDFAAQQYSFRNMVRAFVKTGAYAR